MSTNDPLPWPWEMPPSRTVRLRFSLLSFLLATGLMSLLLGVLGGSGIFLSLPLGATLILLVIWASAVRRLGLRQASFQAASFVATSVWTAMSGLIVMAIYLAFILALIAVLPGEFIYPVPGRVLPLWMQMLELTLVLTRLIAVPAFSAWLVARWPWAYYARWSCAYPWLLMCVPAGVVCLGCSLDELPADSLWSFAKWSLATVSAFVGGYVGERTQRRLLTAEIGSRVLKSR